MREITYSSPRFHHTRAQFWKRADWVTLLAVSPVPITQRVLLGKYDVRRKN